MEATVGEIHRYPLRPEGYAEPLFHTKESRKEVLEHLARGGWLLRASGSSAPVTGVWSGSGRFSVDRGAGERGAGSQYVLASWREVDRWWEPDGGVDVVWRLFESVSGKHEVRAEAAPAQPVKPVS